jgi:hypothetical protein
VLINIKAFGGGDLGYPESGLAISEGLGVDAGEAGVGAVESADEQEIEREREE